MKVWIKYLLGALIGIACAFVLPVSNPGLSKALAFLTEIVIKFGRSLVIPVIFFTGITAFNRIRDTKLILKTGVWISSVIVISSLVLTFVGLISILVVKLPRIPITVEDAAKAVSLNVADLFRGLFLYSDFDSLSNGTFLLAAIFWALLIGFASTADPILFKPVTQLADSLSKLMYNINVIFTEFLSIGMIAILCSWTIQFRTIIASGVFTPLILMLLADLVLVAAVIYPVTIRYLCHDPHPYRILYASACSVMTAFFSGDANLALQLNIRHGKESLGIRRRINGVTHPLFSIFARGGSALVTTVSFIVIWRSYSSLKIPFLDVAWIFFTAFALSFLLGSIPAGGAFVSLTLLCSLYSRGFESGYLMLQPAAPIICSFAAAFDALTSIFGSYIVGVKTKLVEHHSIKHFI